MKLTRKNVDDVLVQANYMSGDRYTIASALRINQRLGVVVLAPKGDLGEAATMRDLYQNAPNGRYRVLVHEIAVAPTATAEEKKAAVRTAYKQVEERMRPADRPAWLAALVADNVWVHTATFGTKAVAAAFEANAASSRDDLRDFWRVGFERDLAAWVAARGFTPHRRYVLLWAKAGARQAEKAHHFTSILTWRLLQERIARETDIVPVAVGDDIGLRSHPSLVAFWNDGEWKRMCGGKADTRREQLGLWTYLAQNMASISIIGMRSGAVEVPALLGIRTLYLEERHNQQAERMAKWIGKVPTYERQIVEAPPGIKQQIAWREQNLAHVRGPERQHLVSHTAHTRSLTLGFDRVERWPGPKPRTPFRHPRAASEFMLQDREFDGIVTWVRAAPAARPRPVASTPRVATPMADVAALVQRERLAGKSYGAIYSSAGYRALLPTIADS